MPERNRKAAEAKKSFENLLIRMRSVASIGLIYVSDDQTASVQGPSLNPIHRCGLLIFLLLKRNNLILQFYPLIVSESSLIFSCIYSLAGAGPCPWLSLGVPDILYYCFTIPLRFFIIIRVVFTA